MEQYGKDIKKIDAQLADPGLYARDPAKAKKLSIERGLIAKFLAEAEDVWLKATEAHEQAASEMAGA
jgi:ATP-binding cassette, subfamily F, member 3